MPLLIIMVWRGEMVRGRRRVLVVSRKRKRRRQWGRVRDTELVTGTLSSLGLRQLVSGNSRR